ncbi:MAG: plasmid pRiA4b ORF-3 family protein [Gammaproteobacteria bacterium]|nr:plasmid pRiA4b ORF-3 family protein [Gammaproteobacteria bacterium]
MAARRPTASQVYELYVVLENIEPPIWRRLLVPAAITLPKLHDLLQLAMGWTDSHLHSFTFGEESYGMADVDGFAELDMRDERRQILGAALGESAREFLYEYDFGDGWRHRIAVTPLARPNLDWRYPLCTGGGRAAPPEDVGGPGGYAEFLAGIRDPGHTEHESLLIWAGGAFDPEGFDLNAINRALRFGPPAAARIPRARVLRTKSPARPGPGYRG